MMSATPPRRPGKGTRLTSNIMGDAISAVRGGSSWPHPFRPIPAGRGVSVSRGVVDGMFEPVIGKVPISGAGGAAPVLALDGALANADGESWVCLEVVPNAAGALTKDSGFQIVHRNEPQSIDPLLGRCALFMVLWRGAAVQTFFDIVYFNVRYVRITPAPGQGLVRHLFL